MTYFANNKAAHNVAVTPIITASTYAVATVLGGIQTLPGFFSPAAQLFNNPGAKLLFVDSAVPPVSIWLFGDLPTGPYADQSVFVRNLSDNYLGRLNVTTDIFTLSSLGQEMQTDDKDFPLFSLTGGTSLYAVVTLGNAAYNSPSATTAFKELRVHAYTKS